MQQLTDEQLLAKLSSLGVALDRESLGRLCEQNLGAVQVSQRLMDPTTFEGRRGQAQIHQIENCVAHLWQRWFPDQPSFDRLEDKMLAGYDLVEARDVAGACRVWLEGWAEALALLDRASITSLEELDRQFSGGEFVLSWLHALDQELWNAGLDDPQFLRARIAFCEEGLRRFAASVGDEFFTENCRHALAESYFELGDTGKTDALYRQWLSADPQWGWGWGPPEATKPVMLRSRINPSEGKTRQTTRKYCRPFWFKIVDWRGFPGDDRTDCQSVALSECCGRGAVSSRRWDLDCCYSS